MACPLSCRDGLSLSGTITNRRPRSISIHPQLRSLDEFIDLQSHGQLRGVILACIDTPWHIYIRDGLQGRDMYTRPSSCPKAESPIRRHNVKVDILILLLQMARTRRDWLIRRPDDLDSYSHGFKMLAKTNSSRFVLQHWNLPGDDIAASILMRYIRHYAPNWRSMFLSCSSLSFLFA